MSALLKWRSLIPGILHVHLKIQGDSNILIFLCPHGFKTTCLNQVSSDFSKPVSICGFGKGLVIFFLQTTSIMFAHWEYIFLKYLFFMYIGVLTTCMTIHHMYDWYLQITEKRSDIWKLQF